MNWFLVGVRQIAMVVASLFLAALLISGAALAEPQKISIKDLLWSGGGKCPEKEEKIFFDVVGKWCEVEIKNENASEEVLIEKEQIKVFAGCNLTEGLCIFTKVPLSTPECEEGKTKLTAGKACFNRLLYLVKPASLEEVGYHVETKSIPGKTAAGIELHFLVE